MSLLDRIKNSFVAGLILIAPLAVTLLVLRIVVNWSRQFINPVVKGTRLVEYTGNIELVAQIVAVVLIVLAITLLGYLAQLTVGRNVFGSIGKVVNFIPLVNTIYLSVRQVADALVDRTTRYESVVLVEYPHEEVYSIGLVTGEAPAGVGDVGDGKLYNVFFPNSPNPTAGRLALIPEDRIHETEMSVREGLRLIVTTGIGAEDDDELAGIDTARLPED